MDINQGAFHCVLFVKMVGLGMDILQILLVLNNGFHHIVNHFLIYALGAYQVIPGYQPCE